MSNLMGLNEISFAQRDPAVIEQSIVGGFEAAWLEATGETLTLYSGDPRRLALLTAAYELALQRNLIDFTGKMNLLAYAVDDYLDHLGLHVAVERMQKQPAITTMRLTLSTALGTVYTIPSGVRFTPDGKLYFISPVPIDLLPGVTEIDFSVFCIESGIVGNGFLPGQINRLVDPLPWVQKVENVTVSTGGADTEDDESLRERIRLAPERYSTAGPKGGYRYYAKSAHTSIGDVAVFGPEDNEKEIDPPVEPGEVHIYPLTKDGNVPEREIMDLVFEILNREEIRPDTDHVFVLPAHLVAYDLRVTYWIDKKNATQARAIQTAVEKAIDDWLLWQRSELGRDINPSALYHMVVAAGAKRAEIAAPAFTVLKDNEVAVVGDKEVVYGGIEDG